ncbi:MAG: BatA domain-containing protein [Candidatus Rifleibacteriota bacterium]
MSLTFASPWFLLGLLSLAIPIYLHLYHRKTPIRKEFPSLRLIRLSVEFTARRKKMKNIILLALRLFLLILVIAALARPFIGQSASAKATSSNPAASVILLDNSMSMGSTHQGISLFNTARARALEILEQMQPGDKATVGLLNDPGRLLYSQLTWDRDTLKKSVANAPLSMAGTSIYSSLLSALKLLTPLKTYKRTVYVITDMTESSWKPLIERYNLKDIDPGIDLILVPVGGATPENMAITRLESGAPIVMANREMPLKIKVANFSSRARKSKLAISINSQRKYEREIELPPDSEKEFSIDCKLVKTGMNHIKADIQTDALPFDNERHLAVKVFEPCNVLIIKSESKEQKANNDDIFLKYAINPLNKAKSNNFITESRTPTEAANLDLNKYAVISILNLNRLPDSLIGKLSQYILNGGNLITFIGNRVDPEWYNKHLIDNPGGEYILPARLYKRVGNAVSKSIAYQMTDIDFGHPAFAIFNEEGNGDPSRAHIYEFFQVKPNPDALTLCRMSHGLPGIVEEKRGQGRSMLITFPADTSWSDWPLKPTWLPFLHQTIIAMVTSQELEIGNIKPGMPIAATIKNKAAQDISMLLPDQKEIAINTSETSSGLTHFSSRETNQNGYYLIKAGNEVLTGFAVNPPPTESNLKRINLRKIPRFISMNIDTSKTTVKEKVSLLREGYDLSRAALWLLLAILLTECWFANRKTLSRVRN